MNNVFVGFPSSAQGCDYASAATCIGFGADDPGAMVSGNVHVASVDDAHFANLLGPDGMPATADDDVHIASALSALAGAGHPTSLDDCRPTAAESDTPIAAPACGGLSSDLDGVTYASPPSVGAFEYVP